MLKVDIEKWGQTSACLREQALNAAHSRSRERLMALYEICCGQNATRVGRQTGRNPQTVMEWVHRYNAKGPEALLYRHTGGHPPLCLQPSKLS
ncbi:MAG: helix-turn-helix domain-containing protein [Cyanobacteria bacterium J06635_1]